MADMEYVRNAVVKGKIKDIQAIVQESVNAGVGPKEILNEGLISAMDVCTRAWKEGQMFMPEVLRAAKTLQAGMQVLKPLLEARETAPRATFAIGTVKRDLHDIGKNLVAVMVESAGYEVINLGIDLDPAVFVEQVEKGVTCIGISALLTTTIPEMKGVIKAITDAGLRNKCKIWVGGAPVTQAYADEIGADFYAVDAAACIDQLNSLYAGSKKRELPTSISTAGQD